MATPKQFTSWSFSRYSDWKRCPLAAKLKHLDKISEPKNPAMQRGADIHDEAAAYLKGNLAKLSPDLALFKDEFKRLRLLSKKRLLGFVCEDNWAFTAEWDKTQWNDWLRCWVRIKLDCAHHETIDVMVVTDWKTGKFREELHEEYLEQLELYALAALILHPHLKEVRPRLVYTDQGLIYPPVTKPIVYTQADVPRLKKLWAKRINPMMKDTRFAPKPNSKCHWCFYGQSGVAKGGPGLCRF